MDTVVIQKNRVFFFQQMTLLLLLLALFLRSVVAQGRCTALDGGEGKCMERSVSSSVGLHAPPTRLSLSLMHWQDCEVGGFAANGDISPCKRKDQVCCSPPRACAELAGQSGSCVAVSHCRAFECVERAAVSLICSTGRLTER